MSESEVLRTFTATLGLQVNLAGTGNTEEIEKKRVFLLTDFVVRAVFPLVLQRSGFPEEARNLRRLQSIRWGSNTPAVLSVPDSLRDCAHAIGDTAPHFARLMRKMAGDIHLNPSAMIRINHAAAVADCTDSAIRLGIPEDELIDLALDVVADAMVIE